jgi:hypothetical protein
MIAHANAMIVAAISTRITLPKPFRLGPGRSAIKQTRGHREKKHQYKSRNFPQEYHAIKSTVRVEFSVLIFDLKSLAGVHTPIRYLLVVW